MGIFSNVRENIANSGKTSNSSYGLQGGLLDKINEKAKDAMKNDPDWVKDTVKDQVEDAKNGGLTDPVDKQIDTGLGSDLDELHETKTGSEVSQKVRDLMNPLPSVGNVNVQLPAFKPGSSNDPKNGGDGSMSEIGDLVNFKTLVAGAVALAAVMIYRGRK